MLSAKLRGTKGKWPDLHEAEREDGNESDLLSFRHVESYKRGDRKAEQCKVGNDAEDDWHRDLPICRGATLTVDRRRRVGKFEIASLPVESHGHTLEQEIKSRSEEPEDSVDEGDEPEYPEPALVDEEYATVEE